MPNTNDSNDLYDVILIYSGVGYAALCPGIPGAVSQGTDQQDALAMIADAMVMCRSTHCRVRTTRHARRSCASWEKPNSPNLWQNASSMVGSTKSTR